VSSTLTSKMLPNKKLNRSSVNPPDRLISSMPSARPDESNMATVASAGILVDSRNFVMPNAPSMESVRPVQRG
jgi:hypothetical protein